MPIVIVPCRSRSLNAQNAHGIRSECLWNEGRPDLSPIRKMIAQEPHFAVDYQNEGKTDGLFDFKKFTVKSICRQINAP